MEFERYEDVIDAFEIDNMGYETLTDYIKGNNIRIAEIDMSPMGDLAKAFNKKDGGLMVAVQKFNQGGKAYDPRASVEDMAKAIKTSSAGTDNQKLRMLMDYSMSANPQATPQTVMANQGKMEKLLGLQTNPNFNYMKPSGPALIMPPMESTGFRQDPGYFGNEGIMINGKRYMSEDEAIEDMGIETYNRFMAKGGMAGGKTYHQYHDQFVPPDSESEMYANGGGVGSMMQPKKKNFKMQGGVRNYLGNQKQVKAPLKWQSSPDHPTTELAYITKKEKDLLVKSDLHGSLKGKVNRGPSGIISLNGFGSRDSSQNVGGGDISSAETGGGRSGMSQRDANDFRAAAINAGAGQRVNPGFFDSRTNLTKAELDLAKAYRNDPANIFANQAYKNTGQTGLRGFISGGGILGALVRGLGQKFGLGKKAGEATYDMSEFNNLRNVDGEVIDTTGLELDKGMFGFPVNTNVTNQKPKANIIGKNLNDFQLGNPGKYATADALTEANMADYQTSLVDEFTPYGIDRTNLYEDFADNRDLISETATSPQFNTSLINEFGVKDRGTFDANEGLQFGSIPATADQGFGLMNSDAAKAAAMSVMSNAFNQNVNPATSDMGFPDRNMNFPDTGMLVADASKNNNLQTLENIINKDMFEKNLEPAIENQNQKNQRLEELQKELGIIT